MKILLYSDALCGTGFATVSHNIIKELQKLDYTFEVLAINHHGSPYHIKGSEYEYLKDADIYPACMVGENDLLGLNRAKEFITTHDFDLLFCVQDIWNINKLVPFVKEARESGKKFKFAAYFPVDCDNGVTKEWMEDLDSQADLMMTYTEFASEQIAKVFTKKKVFPIYHGTDLEKFFPITADERIKFRKWYFQQFPEDAYIITNVNRNQQRKDLPRTIMAFKEFCKGKEDSFHPCLYLHCNPFDPAWLNLKEFIKQNAPELEGRISTPNPELFVHGQGVPVDFLRYIYGSSDLAVSTTLGEGWGLSLTEAMACKVPVAFPYHTSIKEIVGGETKGGLVWHHERGSVYHPDTFVALNNDHGFTRPICGDMREIAGCWDTAVLFGEDTVPKAYEWASKLSWPDICKKWDVLFRGIASN